MLSSHQLASYGWGASSSTSKSSHPNPTVTVLSRARPSNFGSTTASSASFLPSAASSLLRVSNGRAKVIAAPATMVAFAVFAASPTATSSPTAASTPQVHSSSSASSLSSIPISGLPTAASRVWSSTRSSATTGVAHIRALPLSVKIIGGIAAAGLLAYVSSRKVRRILYFWRKSLPILLKYKRYEAKSKNKSWTNDEEEARAWQQLHHDSAPKVLTLINKLRGIYVKLGQVIGARRDFTPDIYADKLQTLVDSMEPHEWKPMKKLIEKELQCSIDTEFSSFNETPIGAASIGQVHEATLRSDGSRVVLKAQYPESEDLIMADLHSFGFFTRLAQPQAMEAHHEMTRQIAAEFDFHREADMQTMIAANIKNAFDSRRISVPRVYSRYTRNKVMVMEYVAGTKIVPWLKANRDASVPVIQTILEAYGQMLLVDGTFHGDPHPGNFLIGDAPHHTLHLIDFGQCKVLSHGERHGLCNLIIAMADGDHARIAQCMFRVGFKSRYMRDTTMIILANALFDTCPAMPSSNGPPQVLVLTPDMEEKIVGSHPNFYAEFNRIEKEDPITCTPHCYVLALRVSLLLRGLFSLASVMASSAQHWRAFAVKGLQRSD